MRKFNRTHIWSPSLPSREPARNLSEQQVRAYFEKTNIWKIRLLFSSLALALVCAALAYALPVDRSPFSVVGFASFMAAFVFLNSLRKSAWVPSDREYDAWVNSKANQRLLRALRKLNKDTLSQEEQESILRVQGYVLKEMSGADRYKEQDMLWKKGKDGRNRYSINVFTYFLPIERQLAVIEIDVNAVSHREKKEETHEFYFEEIVDTLTTVEDKIARGFFGEYFHRTQHLTLSLRDGTAISVTFLLLFLDHPPDQEIDESPIDTEVDYTIAQIRNLINSNKRKLTLS